MMRFVQIASIVGIFAMLASVALAHGGSYSGPAGAGSGGGYAPAGAGTPGPGPGPAGGGTGSPGGTTGPSGGGTTGPGSPSPGSPGTPGGGGGAPAGPGGTAAPSGGSTPGGVKKAASDANLTWGAWWFFNDEKYLNLKSKIRSEENETENADLFGGSTVGGDEITKVNAKMIREQINPVLKFALKDPFYDTRAAALIALGKTGMPNALADLKQLMGDEHMSVRETSFLAMGILGNKEAIPTLISAMNDTTEARKWTKQNNGVDTRTRAFAALGIGLIGARENDLGDTQAVSALLEMMNARENEKQRDLQIAPIVALGIMKAKEATPPLIKFMEDKSNNAWARAYAATSLAKIGDPAALKPLLAGLKDKQNAVVQSSAMALGAMGINDKDVVDGLQKLVKSGSDLGAKNFAIMSLAEIGGEDNRNYLAKMTKKGNLFERSFSALGMGIYMYSNPTDPAKAEVCEELHKFFKAEKNLDIRGANAIALGLMEYDTAGEDILEALKDGGQASLRSHLCTALGLMRYTAAIPEIRRTVSDKGDVDLRRNASIALGLMGDKDAVKILQKEIEASENSIAVHGAVTQGLGFIGDRSAVPTLVEFLQQRDKFQDSTRAFAAVALGLLGDKDDIPIISKISEHNNYLIRTDALGEVLTIL